MNPYNKKSIVSKENSKYKLNNLRKIQLKVLLYPFIIYFRVIEPD
jgi:hypothetical protein